MVASIIDGTQGGESEVRSWYHQGKTYAWMVQAYQRKYGLTVSPAMFSYRRSVRRWERRRARRVDELFPWAVQDEHKSHRLLVLLRLEARSRQSGLDTMPTDDVRELTAFRALLKTDNLVIDYDPQTESGFSLVPREASDNDIVRQPSEASLVRRRTHD